MLTDTKTVLLEDRAKQIDDIADVIGELTGTLADMALNSFLYDVTNDLRADADVLRYVAEHSRRGEE